MLLHTLANISEHADLAYHNNIRRDVWLRIRLVVR